LRAEANGSGNRYSSRVIGETQRHSKRNNSLGLDDKKLQDIGEKAIDCMESIYNNKLLLLTSN
jgi:hypothetical protein